MGEDAPLKNTSFLVPTTRVCNRCCFSASFNGLENPVWFEGSCHVVSKEGSGRCRLLVDFCPTHPSAFLALCFACPVVTCEGQRWALQSAQTSLGCH